MPPPAARRDSSSASGSPSLSRVDDTAPLLAAAVDLRQKLLADLIASVGAPIVAQPVEVREGAAVEQDVGDAVVEGLVGHDALARLGIRMEATRWIGHADIDQP